MVQFLIKEHGLYHFKAKLTIFVDFEQKSKGSFLRSLLKEIQVYLRKDHEYIVNYCQILS